MISVLDSSYSPAFDLYRSIAVLSVVFGHFVLYHPDMPLWARLPLLLPINYGVPIFFLISGYLLAGSYLSIQSKTPGIGGAAAAFYRTRLFRIYPAYLVWLVVFWFLGPRDHMDLMVHLLNIHNAFPAYCHSINAVFWSLAVEFQWYIAAPLLIVPILFEKPEKGWRIAIIFFLASVFLRNLLIHQYVDSHWPISELWRLATAQIYVELYSFILGILIFKMKDSRARVPGIAVSGLWIFLIGASLLTYVAMSGEKRMTFGWMTLVLNLKNATQLALAVLMFHYRHIKLPRGAQKPIRWVALISYSLYLIHLPILEWMKDFQLSLFLQFFVYLIISSVIAASSYLLVEKPAIRYARQLNNRIRTANPLPDALP